MSQLFEPDRKPWELPSDNDLAKAEQRKKLLAENQPNLASLSLEAWQEFTAESPDGHALLYLPAILMVALADITHGAPIFQAALDTVNKLNVPDIFFRDSLAGPLWSLMIVLSIMIPGETAYSIFKAVVKQSIAQRQLRQDVEKYLRAEY